MNFLSYCLLCCIRQLELFQVCSFNSSVLPFKMMLLGGKFHVVLFIMLYKVVLTFTFVDKTLMCDRSLDWAALSCDSIYCAIQGGSNFLHRIFFLGRVTSLINTRTGFQYLRILGLSSTRISNKLLLNGTLNHCKSLARLNLSRTRVSNKRLSHLVLPLLSQLNLDWTRVTSDCRALLTGKIYLTCVRIPFDLSHGILS